MKKLAFFLFGILAGTLVFIGTLWGVAVMLDFVTNGKGFWHDLMMDAGGVYIVSRRIYEFFRG